MTIKIGHYIYSPDTERRFYMNEECGIESMLSERLNISWLWININIDNPDGLVEVHIGIWKKVYEREDFDAGIETFVEQVILDYTFGVID